MALITADDLYNRIYEEVVDEITRENTAITDRAISAAIQEVKMYLSRFDLVALFGTGITAPTVVDDYLKTLCVDVAVWRLVLLSNVSIDFNKTEATYKMALDTLKNIQKGMAQPEGWPYKDTTNQTAPQGNSVRASYNTKRKNDF